MKKLVLWLLALCLFLEGCGTGASLEHRIRNAKSAINDDLISAFFKSAQEAKDQLGLTEENLVETRGSQETYQFSHLWCGVNTDTSVSLGFDRVGTISAKIALENGETSARKSAEDCFDLFEAQFGNPYGYVLGDVTRGGEFLSDENTEELFEKYWENPDLALAFRFYVNDEKSSYEFAEYRIEKNRETQKMELSLMLFRSVRR